MPAITLSEFARLKGWSPSYVTKLKADGRLVLTENGKRVLVEESVVRIEETKDPNRDDVGARHARARQARAGGASPTLSGDSPAAPGMEEVGRRQEQPPRATPGAVAETPAGQSYANARAIKERFLALGAKLEYERAIGKVVDSAAVIAAGAEIGTVLRATLENLTDQLAPALAEGDPERERRIYARLVEHMEMVLTEISDKLKALGTRLAEPPT